MILGSTTNDVERSIHSTGFLWFHCLPTPNNSHAKELVGEETNLTHQLIRMSPIQTAITSTPSNSYPDTTTTISRSMQSQPLETSDEVSLMKLLNKIHVHELSLIHI